MRNLNERAVTAAAPPAGRTPGAGEIGWVRDLNADAVGGSRSGRLMLDGTLDPSLSCRTVRVGHITVDAVADGNKTERA